MAIDPQALARLLELEDTFEMYPGRRPGGSGATGIGRTSSIGHAPSGGMFSRQDARAYGDMVRDQMEYEQLSNPGEQMKVRHDPRTYRPSIDALQGEPYTGAVDPSWTDARGFDDALRRQTGTGQYYQSHEQFKKRFGR